MPVGPGRFGAQAAAILEKTGGDLCVVLIVADAQAADDKQAVFDVATTDPVHVAALPRLLRMLADSIEQDVMHDATPTHH